MMPQGYIIEKSLNGISYFHRIDICIKNIYLLLIHMLKIFLVIDVAMTKLQFNFSSS